MIAEIYNKLNRSVSNLDRLEDLLTGNFFGSLRYLPFRCGIKPILQKSTYPARLLNCIDDINRDNWHSNIHFWSERHWNGTEPDVVIEFDDIVILVEVKLDSWLSSDDNEETNLHIEEDKCESKNQLARESRLLASEYHKHTKKILLLLAPEESAVKIYNDVSKRQRNGKKIIADGVDFGYITWQKVLDNLKGVAPDNPFQEIVVQDLINLLQQKGFERFNRFNIEGNIVDPNDYWEFNYTAITTFLFGNDNEITEELYYEFK